MARPSSSRVAIGIMGRIAARGPVLRITIRGLRIRVSGSGLSRGASRNKASEENQKTPNAKRPQFFRYRVMIIMDDGSSRVAIGIMRRMPGRRHGMRITIAGIREVLFDSN